MLRFLLLFLFFYFSQGVNDRCYYSRNNIIKIFKNETNKSTKVHAVLCGYDGYSSFSISDSESTADVIFTVLYWNKNETSSFQTEIIGQNFTRTTKKINIVSSVKKKKYFTSLREIYFELPLKYLKKQNFIIFRCHDEIKPIKNEDENFFIIPSPTIQSEQIMKEGMIKYVI